MTDLTRQDMIERSSTLAELISDLAYGHIENQDFINIKGIDHHIEGDDDGDFYLAGSDGNDFNFDIPVTCWPRRKAAEEPTT